MTTRLMRLIMITSVSLTTLIGCDNNDEKASTANTAMSADTDATTPASDNAGHKEIDWSKIKSGQRAADPTTYDYPFAIDSQNVRDYADYFKIDNATAQHSMTVSMASNEALSKVLDQLGSSYVSHEITDGEDIKLIVHTTPDIKADRFDYVLAEDFGKGLVLPIEIQPDGVKEDSDTDGHSDAL